MRSRTIAGSTCLASLVLAGGCRTEASNTLADRHFHLSAERPASDEFRVKLLRVELDGMVVFQDWSGVRSEMPREMQPGLRVVRSDPATQTATLAVFRCWYLRERYFGPFLLESSYR